MNKQKLILPISIIVGCIIIGFSIYDNKVSQQKSILEKKQECFKYQEKILDKLKEKEEEILEENINYIIPRNTLKIKSEIEQIFYSPVKDSCLVAYEFAEYWDYGAEDFTGLIIDDVLTGENYFISGYSFNNNDDIGLYKIEFEQAINQLK